MLEKSNRPSSAPAGQEIHINNLSFTDPGVGKIIIYSHEGTFHLAGTEILGLGKQVKMLVDGKSPTDILDIMKSLLERPAFTRNPALHRDIPHKGTVLGGATALLFSKSLYIVGRSKEFGPLPLEISTNCAAQTGLRVFSDVPSES